LLGETPAVPPVEEAIASPLTLLLGEERHSDRQAEDILLLTYTSDLGFFEAFGFGAAQACGARVTVISDVRMSAPDPRAARRAGRTYLSAHAFCAGAFHPKLVLIAGPARVTAAIGSGNATLAGWQANAELWTVLRGDTASFPASLLELSEWLRGLPHLVRLSRGGAEALKRSADHIDTVAASAGTLAADRVRLVSSTDGPILDQLPSGPVDELCVTAPFHDLGAVALRALVVRMRPKKLRIAYQPELTQLDGAAVAALAGEVDTELLVDAETRYRHGKLVEWAVADARSALTGSPNLSGAALLHGLAAGGNCELGVITPVAETLLPDDGAVHPSAVAEKRLVIRSRAGGGPLLLGATRVEDGLHVMFARPLPTAGHLDLSHAASPPETWERAGDVAAGDLETTRTIAADGGSRVRLVTTAEDGTPRYSNIVFVVDPARVAHRPGITPKHAPTTCADDLFGDPRLAERVFADLVALSDELPPPGPRVPAAEQPKSAGVSTRADGDSDGWERYLDECAGRVGHPLLRFALGLPALPGGEDAAFEPLLKVAWAEESVSDNEVGLDDENVDEVAVEQETDNGSVPTLLPDLSNAEAAIRRRYRRWADRLVELSPRLGAPGRMLVTRLVLWTAAAGAWGRNDHHWVKLLSQSLRSLGESNLPPQAEPQVGSLIAVALSVLRSVAPRLEHTEDTLAFDRAAEAVAHLLPASEPDYIEEYTHLLEPAFGFAVDAEKIQAVAAEVVQNDPVEDAYWTLLEHGRDLHRHGDRLLHVVGAFGNPLLIALEAVGAAQDAALLGAWATATSGRWALCVWQRPNLFTIENSGGAHLRWRHYRLTGLVTPLGLAREKSLAGATSVPHGPSFQPVPEAVAALDELGLTTPGPPAQCLD
jgi:hypothetical protein